MKKIMCAGLVLLMAAPAVASAQDRGDRRQERLERRQERLEQREDRREARQGPAGDVERRLERQFGDRIDRRQERLERREDRLERREDRRDDRRDYGRYYGQPRTYYYPSPSYNYHYYSPPRSYNYYYPSRPYYGYNYGPSYGYGYGYNYNYYQPRWYRGAVLPYEYRRRYYVPNYGYYGWTPPPPGYAYYRTDTGEILLAAIATGIILSVIAGAF